MIKEDERLNKVKIAKTKKIRKDANDVAQKELYIYIYIVNRILEYKINKKKNDQRHGG